MNTLILPRDRNPYAPPFAVWHKKALNAPRQKVFESPQLLAANYVFLKEKYVLEEGEVLLLDSACHVIRARGCFGPAECRN